MRRFASRTIESGSDRSEPLSERRAHPLTSVASLPLPPSRLTAACVPALRLLLVVTLAQMPRVILNKDALEPRVLSMLTEDRMQTMMNYVEFLCHVHRQIQQRFN